MRSKIFCSLWIAALSLTFAVPANAYSDTANGNGGLGNGMGTNTHTHGVAANNNGTKMYVQSNDGVTRTKATSSHEVSVYGTGTGSQFFNVNANASGTLDHNPLYRTQSNDNGGYRALETSSNDMDWSWLGLLGLLGLFGLRSRNPERGR
jgi:hypothetical protein